MYRTCNIHSSFLNDIHIRGTKNDFHVWDTRGLQICLPTNDSGETA